MFTLCSYAVHRLKECFGLFLDAPEKSVAAMARVEHKVKEVQEAAKAAAAELKAEELAAKAEG